MYVSTYLSTSLTFWVSATYAVKESSSSRSCRCPAPALSGCSDPAAGRAHQDSSTNDRDGNSPQDRSASLPRGAARRTLKPRRGMPIAWSHPEALGPGSLHLRLVELGEAAA